MANFNEKSYATKLRGTDTSKSHSNSRSTYRYHANFDLESNCEFLDNSYISQQSTIQNNLKPKLETESSRIKYGGRGMAIAQMSQSITNNNSKNLIIKNCNPEFSNSTIEQYFKNLKKENTKKIEEQNKKIWEEMLYSKKSS